MHRTARPTSTSCVQCVYVREIVHPSSCSFVRMAVVAINTRLVVPGKLDGIGWFTLETVQRITSNHPEHDFHLFFDRRPPEDLFPGENVTCHLLLPPARRPILQDLWFDYSVPRWLAKVKADLFLSPDGFLSMRTDVPQVAVQHDLNFEHHPEWLPARIARHYQKRFPLAARRAVRMATVSRFSAEDIHNRYGVPMNEIDVVYNGAGTAYQVTPLGLDRTASEKAVRNRYAAGNPYFVFIGTQHPRKNLEGLLKAFECYRDAGGKWDLLLVGTALWRRRRFDLRTAVEALSSDTVAHVHLTGWLPQDELAQVLAGAGALTFIPWFEGFGIPIIEAFSAGTPVIHSDRTSLPEVAAGAGLEVDPDNLIQVAEAMLRMEQEPALRDALRAKGKERAEDFSWDRTAGLLWNCLVRAGEQVGLEMGEGVSDTTVV